MGIKGNADTIQYHIDSTRMPEKNKLIVRGFAISASHEKVTYRVFRKDGAQADPEDYVLTTTDRTDVSELLFHSAQWGEDVGFELVMTGDDVSKVTLEMSVAGAKETVVVSGKNPIEKLKEKREQSEFKKTCRGYRKLRRRYSLYEEHLEEQRKKSFAFAPKISVVIPVYEPNLDYLKQMISSIQDQTYSNWEICIGCGTKGKVNLSGLLRKYKNDEPRFKFKMLERNEGIAGNTNQALELIQGDVVVFADQDDLLEEDAFFRIVEAMNLYPDADIVYTDEDKVCRIGKRYYCYEPHFKPDYNPDLLLTNNYISHLTAIRWEIVQKNGGLDPATDGAQDYDYILRACEKARRVVHIPRVLYHWRNHPGSTAAGRSQKDYCTKAGLVALEKHLNRCHVEADAKLAAVPGYYQVNYRPVQRKSGMLSVVFTGDGTTISMKELNKKASLLNDGNVEVLLSTPKTGLSNNPKGEKILFLNARAQFEDSGWLESLETLLARDDVGAVGGRLINLDKTIYSMGMVFAKGEVYPMFAGMSDLNPSYFNRNHLQQDVSILSLDFMLMDRVTYEAAGGLAKNVSPKIQSTDLSLGVRKMGLRLVTVPQISLEIRHLMDGEQEGRNAGSEGESDEMIRSKWQDVLNGTDPYFSQFLRIREDGNWEIDENA